jgi:hypothetical protein
MTAERRAVDRLLALFPDFDLLEVDWQLPNASQADPGPWLVVTLGQRSDDGGHAWARRRYAIWKLTGAVHGIGANGAVIDPPVIEGRIDVQTIQEWPPRADRR